MLIWAMSEVEIALYGLLGFIGLIALALYFPIALVHEITRTNDEVLPSWMGPVRARRTRVRVVVGILGGLLALAIFTTAWVSYRQQ